MGKKRAKEHYDFIREQYHKEIDNSIANTTIHACESVETRIPQYQNNYSVIPEDSVSCLFSLESKDNISPVIKSLVVYIFKEQSRRKKAYAQNQLYFQLSKLLNLLITHGITST